MHGRLLGLLAVSVGLSGCLSNPNAMVFGTNTTFGVSAGAGATATPSIVVGYERQEAVLMPLVAAADVKGGEVTSCKVEPGQAPGSDHLKDHPCVLVGRGVTSTGGNESDSMSVLASFGTDGEARVNSQNPSISGSITQYFATGLAARRLADRSGAAAVATGPAALLSASGWTAAELEKEVDALAKGQAAVAQRIEGDTSFKALLPLMDDATGTKRFSTLCVNATTAAQCATIIRQPGVLGGISASLLENAAKVQKTS